LHQKKNKNNYLGRKRVEGKQVDVVLEELHLFADENVHEKKEVHEKRNSQN